MECIQCLHEDLAGCYRSPFAFDENRKEDRHKEYRLLQEHLEEKYRQRYIKEDLSSLSSGRPVDPDAGKAAVSGNNSCFY